MRNGWLSLTDRVAPIWWNTQPDDKATNYIENVKVTVENNWKIIAKKHGLSRNEIEYMSPAFNMEYK